MAALSNRYVSAVDAIIAETADLIALEQIAALNTAHFSTDSSLPSNLESRFRKLKSLPNSTSTNASIPPRRRTSFDRSDSAPVRSSAANAFSNKLPPPPAAAVLSEETRKGIAIPEQQSLGEESSASGGGFHSSLPAAPRDRDRDIDWDWDIRTSPPRHGCCFVFSPKKAPHKRSKGRGGGGHDGISGMGGDLRDLGEGSKRMVAELKEQQHKLKKALREQEKVSMETAKMARWVKQASARMTHSAAIDDLLSDDDEEAREFK